MIILNYDADNVVICDETLFFLQLNGSVDEKHGSCKMKKKCTHALHISWCILRHYSIIFISSVPNVVSEYNQFPKYSLVITKYQFF